LKPRRVAALRGLLAILLVGGLLMALRPLTPHASPENWFPHSDKLVHLSFFAAAWWLGVKAGLRPDWRLGLGLLLYGVGMELAQALFSAGRGAELKDVVADGIGLLLGAALTRGAARRGSSVGQPQEHRG
jgi:VanZ family protein